MKWLILLLLLATPVRAEDSTQQPWAVVKNLSMGFEKFTSYSRNPLLWNSKPRAAVALHADFELARYVRFENKVTGRYDSQRASGVGWELTASVQVLPQLDLGFHHHSQHRLDSGMGQFPNEDSVFLRLQLMGEHRTTQLPIFGGN